MQNEANSPSSQSQAHDAESRQPGWFGKVHRIVAESVGAMPLAVYAYMSTYADLKTGECYPPHDRIAAALRISRAAKRSARGRAATARREHEGSEHAGEQDRPAATGSRLLASVNQERALALPPRRPARSPVPNVEGT